MLREIQTGLTAIGYVAAAAIGAHLFVLLFLHPDVAAAIALVVWLAAGMIGRRRKAARRRKAWDLDLQPNTEASPIRRRAF